MGDTGTDTHHEAGRPAAAGTARTAQKPTDRPRDRAKRKPQEAANHWAATGHENRTTATQPEKERSEPRNETPRQAEDHALRPHRADRTTDTGAGAKPAARRADRRRKEEEDTGHPTSPGKAGAAIAPQRNDTETVPENEKKSKKNKHKAAARARTPPRRTLFYGAAYCAHNAGRTPYFATGLVHGSTLRLFEALSTAIGLRCGFNTFRPDGIGRNAMDGKASGLCAVVQAEGFVPQRAAAFILRPVRNGAGECGRAFRLLGYARHAPPRSGISFLAGRGTVAHSGPHRTLRVRHEQGPSEWPWSVVAAC